MATAPQFPAGPYQAPSSIGMEQLETLIDELAAAPTIIRQSVENLSDEQLDIRYRNWTIRQIVNHLADSHLNCYVRFRWTLTETRPTIKAYDETRWSELPDAKTLDVEPSLAMLSGIHARWTALIRGLSNEELDRSFFHPESQRSFTLRETIPNYVWHTQHHTGQINWLREQNGW